MTKCKHHTFHKGFTLVELLIVVLIIGLVYSIGFSKIQFAKPIPKALTPLNLKKTIISSKSYTGKVTLLCVNRCKTCYLRPNIASAYKPYTNAIDLTDIKAYTVDARNTLARIEYDRYNDQKVCLKMDFYPNGSSTQIILKGQDASYFLPTYFEKAKKFESPEDAKDYWLENSQLVSDNGEFY